MKALFIFLCVVIMTGCGVKGDPLPPVEPSYLGKGRPKYDGKIRKQKLEDTNIFDDEPEKESDQEDDEY